MEIPIIMGVEGEAKEIVEKYGAGLCFEPENEDDFIEKMSKLLDNSSLYTDCKAGCRQLADNFDRKLLAYKMLDILVGVVESK